MVSVRGVNIFILSWLAISAAILLPTNSSATGIRNIFNGQKVSSMGGAGTALSLDGSSIYYNPGALSFTRSGITIGFNPKFAKTAFWEETSNNTYHQNLDVALPFHFYASFGNHKKPWRLGLGLHSPYEITSNWGTGWPGEFIVKNYQLQTTYFQPTFSYNLSNKFGFGVSVIYAVSSVSFIRSLPINGANTDLGELAIQDRAGGVGAAAGIYYQVNGSLALGLTYRSAIRFHSKDGLVNFDVAETQATNFPVSDVEMDFTLPNSLSFGLAYKANSKFTVAIDMNYYTWSQWDSLNFDFEENTDLLQDIYQPRPKHNSFSVNFGSQYELSKWFSFRLGMFYESRIAKEGYIMPDIPNSDVIGVTGGVSFNINDNFELDINLAYFNESERRELKEENYLNFGGKYESAGIVPGIGISFIY